MNKILVPVPITYKTFGTDIPNDGLTNALAVAEMNRFILIYERHKAWLQPNYFDWCGRRRVSWTVHFPKGSPYKSGPVTGSAPEAFEKNYFLNRKFPAEPTLEKGTGDTFKQKGVSI